MLLSSIALLTFIGFAEPADAQVTAPVRRAATRTQPPPPNWSGPQYGAFGGASTMPMNFVEPGAVLCPTTGLGLPPGCAETPFGFSGSRSSFTFGGFVGYNIQFGAMVAGVEGDIAWKRGSISGTLGTTTPGLAGPLVGPPPGVASTYTRTEGFSGSLTQGADGSARARFGMLVTPWTLAYATAGGAFGNICGSFGYAATLTPTAPPGLGVLSTASGAGSSCRVRAGYTIGGGIETAAADFMPALFGSNAKLRFEYRYTDFGTFSQDVPLAATGACGTPGFVCTGNAHIDMRAAFHTFRVGLGFNLGEPIAPTYRIVK
jgi:outer membrane immunogenic protein